MIARQILSRLQSLFGSRKPEAGRVADSPFVALESRIGARFRNQNLLAQALTHKSFANENTSLSLGDNERLEFLGDAVLDLLITVDLMQVFPAASEGELSKLRSSMVNERSLAVLAEGINLGDYLQLGKGEGLSGGRSKPSLLSNTYEALIGALFLDQGLEPCAAMVRRQFAAFFDLARSGGLQQDFKTRLQEVAQTTLQASPHYRLLQETGPDHEKTFEVEILIKKVGYGVGRGRSKKEAEQEAARAALAALAKP